MNACFIQLENFASSMRFPNGDEVTLGRRHMAKRAENTNDMGKIVKTNVAN